jgi:hypothetical protein
VHHRKFGHRCRRWVDAVEKVDFLIGVSFPGGFDPAELSGYYFEATDAGFEVNQTDTITSHLRQTICAVWQVAAQGSGAPAF